MKTIRNILLTVLALGAILPLELAPQRGLLEALAWSDALASATPPPATPPAASGSTAPASGDDTCTSDFESDGGDEEGLITQIVDYLKEIIEDTTQALFEGIIGHGAFQGAVAAAFTLFVTLFGAAFLFGIVPFTFSQAFIRLMKIAVISAVIGPGAWQFFSETAVDFFNDGTDEIIDAVIGIATGDTSGPSVSDEGTPQPFTKLENVVGDALSPEMMVSTITMLTTGPMGLGIGGMLGIGLIAFIQMLIKALRVYCISLVAKALLLGMAPIFIAFMMFEKTKQIFTGWINQLVNYSLQPIMLFAFLAFFVVLIESAIENILSVDICWTSMEHMTGHHTETTFWRFVDEEGNPTGSDFSWEGLVKCIQAGTMSCQDWPVSIIDILAFLILSHLGYRFSDVVVNIATEIASSTLFLDKLRSGLGELIKGPNQVGVEQTRPSR